MKPFDHFSHNEAHKQYEESFSSKNSQVWMRWEYSPEEWALFEQVDFGLLRHRYWRVVGITLLTYALLIGIIAWLTFPLPWPAIGMAACLLTAPILIIGFSGRPYQSAKKRQQARHKQSQHHRVTFSEDAIWEAGAYFSLKKSWKGLEKVEMTDDPPVLHFSYREPFSNWAVNRDSSFIDTLHVLVPRGHEDEARSLLERYRTMIERQKRYREQVLSPREPD